MLFSTITPRTTLDFSHRKESYDIKENTQNLESRLVNLGESAKNITHVKTQGSFISEEEIRLLAKYCPNLSDIRLACAYRIDDDALKTIAELFSKTLVSINLHSASNSFDQTEFCGDMCRIDKSKKHDIKYITDTGVTILLTKCTQLKEIDLSYTNVSPKILEMIATQTHVQKVNVSHCGQYKTREQEWYPVIDKYKSEKLVIIDDRS